MQFSSLMHLITCFHLEAYRRSSTSYQANPHRENSIKIHSTRQLQSWILGNYSRQFGMFISADDDKMTMYWLQFQRIMEKTSDG